MEGKLEQLEAKVLEAITLIKDLRLKNRQLGEQCADLQTHLSDLSNEKDKLQRQLETANALVASTEDFESRRHLIEQKVSGLLEKLEAMG